MFCGHRHCGSSDTATKIVYMTLQDHVIKGSGDFMKGNSSLYIPKGSGDFMKGNSSLYIPTLPKLIAIDIMLMDVQLF